MFPAFVPVRSPSDGRQQRVRRPSDDGCDGRQQRVRRPSNNEHQAANGADMVLFTIAVIAYTVVRQGVMNIQICVVRLPEPV